MNKSFVPLSLSTAGRPPGAAASRPKEPAAASAPAPFRPAAGTPPPPPAIPQPSGEPKVTLERQGDRITRITVQCPCGHITELVCNY